MNIFHATYFFGNEIVNHVAWKRHCAITKKYVFEFRVISTIYYGLSNDYRWKFSFIHHLLRLMMSFSFSSKTFRHSGSAFFVEMCRSTSLVVNTNLDAQKLRLRQHRPFMSIKSFEQTQQVGPARVPLFSLGLKAPRSGPCRWPQREAVRGCVNPLSPT